MNEIKLSDFVEFYHENQMIFLFLGVGIVLYFLVPFFTCFIRNIKYNRLMHQSNIRDIDRMNGFEFEEYLKVLFKKLGYRPEVTRKSGDFGSDVVLKGKNKVVIQAKRYNSKVGLKAVQEVYAAQAYYKSDEAWVLTNNYYTKQAKELAESCNVKLLDRTDLMKFIVEINPEGKIA